MEYDASSDRNIRALIPLLEAEQLKVRECELNGNIVEVKIRSGDAPKAASVVIGQDGFLTWEFWCPFKTKKDVSTAKDLIKLLLTDSRFPLETT
jgi:hypothetical protein